MTAEEIRNLPNYREPEVGQDICIPSSYYLSRGRDDFEGGLCKITRVVRRDSGNPYNQVFVHLEEAPGEYNWFPLIENEEQNMERYGHRRGYPDPDLRPEFNEFW